MINIEDQYVTINGIKVRFWQQGNVGPIILLIHGFAASVDYWMYNINSLAKNHQVYALDLPGFGYSDKPQNIAYSEKFFTDFIKKFINRFKLKHVNLVGHSLGGAVAIHIALKYPKLLDKLILVSSAGLGRQLPYHFKALTLPIIGNFVFRINSKRLIASALRAHVYKKTSIKQEFIDRMYEIFKLPNLKKTMLKILRKYANFRGIRHQTIKPILKNLDTIKTPTLIIWGEEDNLLSIKDAYVAMRHLPNAKLEVIKKCGHIPQIETCRKFNRLVAEFIDIQN